MVHGVHSLGELGAGLGPADSGHYEMSLCFPQHPTRGVLCANTDVRGRGML